MKLSRFRCTRALSSDSLFILPPLSPFVKRFFSLFSGTFPVALRSCDSLSRLPLFYFSVKAFSPFISIFSPRKANIKQALISQPHQEPAFISCSVVLPENLLNLLQTSHVFQSSDQLRSITHLIVIPGNNLYLIDFRAASLSQRLCCIEERAIIHADNIAGY